MQHIVLCVKNMGVWDRKLPVMDHKRCHSYQGHIFSKQTHCFASPPLTLRGASTDLLAQITASESHWCHTIANHYLHSGNARGGFVNRMGHQINSLHFRLSKSYNIILCRSSSQGESEYTIITFLFLPAQEGTITALRHQHHHTLTGLSQGKHYYFTSQLTDCTTRKKLQPGSSSWKSRRDAAGSPTIVKRFF